MYMISLIKNSFIAGILIGIGCIVNLFASSPILGSFLFSLGLMTVIFQQRNLFTGKIGYYNFTKTNSLELLVTLIFNLIGIGTFCYIISHYHGISIISSGIVMNKLSESLLQAFVRSVGCGMLMYIAVEGYRASKEILSVIMPVMVFILCGFDHCIANYGYMVMDDVFYCNQLLVWILGNSIGSLIISKI